MSWRRTRSVKHLYASQPVTNTVLITLIISVVGGMIGSAGLTLSIINYLRDRPVVKVSLQWDMSIKPTPFESRYDHRKPWGLIRVTNIGRRPTYGNNILDESGGSSDNE